MKCPKCGFNSFESHNKCRKCGKDLSSFKAAFNIRPVVHPQEAAQEPAAAAVPGEAAAPPEPAPKVSPPHPAAVAATAALAPDEFAFDSTPPEPTPLVGKDAVESARIPLLQQDGGKGDFSLDDFIHFSELNTGKGVDPTHSFGKGGFDLEDLFPAEQPSREESPAPHPLPLEEEPETEEEQGKAQDWME